MKRKKAHKLQDKIQNLESEISIIKEWLFLAKAQIDGKQLQRATDIGGVTEWIDQSLSLGESGLPYEWRIKPKIEFPVYKRQKSNGTILRFDDKNTCTIMMSKNIEAIGKTLHTLDVDDPDLKTVQTIEIDGIIYYDTQPVWALDDDDNILRSIAFVDAKNHCTFGSDLKRHGYPWDHYTPVKHIELWMIEAWKQLKV